MIQKDGLGWKELDTAIEQEGKEYTGIIKRLYCVKPNGWFSALVQVRTDDGGNRRVDYKLSGIAFNGGSLFHGAHIRFFAAKVHSAQYGIQMQCPNSYRVEIRMDTKTSLRAYLFSDLFPHIDDLMASDLVNRYGTKLADEVLSDSENVALAVGLSEQQRDELFQRFRQDCSAVSIHSYFPHMTNKDMECVALLYGPGAVTVIRNAPYRVLMNLRHDIQERMQADPTGKLREKYKSYRIPFDRIDEIARLDVHVALDHPLRIQAMAEYAIKQIMARQRVTYLLWDESQPHGMDDIYEMMRLMNQPSHPLPDDFEVLDFHRMLVGGLLPNLNKTPARQEGPYCYHLYLRTVLASERLIVDTLKDSFHHSNHKHLLPGLSSWIQDQKNHGTWCLTQEQESAIGMVFSNSLSFVCGGPGRGKTYWASMLLAVWQHLVGNQVLMLGPTGRAVNKLKMGTGYEQCETAARFLLRCRKGTLSLFGMKNFSSDCFGSDVLVLIDEASMFDMREIADLFRYIDKCTVVFMGDKDQLPPVEVGEFLSQVHVANQNRQKIYPTTEFTTCMRTGKQGIIQNSDAIRDGKFDAKHCLNAEFMVEYHYIDKKKEAVDGIAERNRVREGIRQSAIRHYQYMVSQYGESEVLLLSPMRQRGICCTKALNLSLQDQINPKQDYYQWIHDSIRGVDFIEQKGYEVPHCRLDGIALRLYDRVMNTKNHSDMAGFVYDSGNPDLPDFERSDGIYNGDTGKVLRFYKAEDMDSNPTLLIQLDDGRFVRVDVDEFSKEWTFGYAVTVHKAQGSEASCVLFVCSDEGMGITHFLNRNMLYTGVTRAKEHVLLLGSEDAFQMMADSPHIMDRSDLGYDLI